MTTSHHDSDDRSQHANSDATRSARTTRRTFLRGAAAGAGAFALGAGAGAGSVAAQQQIPTPQLQTDGNVIVDPEGNTVTLRGLNIIDPRRADTLAPYRGRTAVEMVDLLTDQSQGWYTQVVRVPLQPCDIAESTTGYHGGPQLPGSFDEDDLRTYLADHVDDVVDRCEERGVYCILDYHRHWTNGSSEGSTDGFDGSWADGNGDQMTVNEDLQQECVMFWDVVAERYGNRDHTIYEVYNEPTKPGCWGDPRDSGSDGVNWVTFVHFIQPAIDKIAEHTDNLQLLGSPSWTQSPEGILMEEQDYEDWGPYEWAQIDEPEHLAMTYHIYPGHNVSMQEAWDTVAGNGEGTVSLDTAVYDEYPLVVTEFGWDDTLGTPTQDNPLPGTTSGFGEPFIEGWMEQHDSISWTAWCGDIWWDPTMFERGEEGWESHTDATIENPYTDTVPQDCPETPCEWHLAGEEVGDSDERMGAYVKGKLAEYADHNNPQVGSTGPSAPSSVTVESTTETTAQVSWTSVAEADEYVVTVDGSQVATPTTTEHEVTGLTAGTTYTIGVASRNAEGTSAPATATATTDGGDGENHCQEVGAADGEQVDGQWVCDVSDDGLHRDVTADGEVGQDDVVHFFENQHRDAWKQPDLFDFSDSDSVGHGDVVALFEHVSL